MQLQFLAPVEIFFMIYCFAAVRFVMSTLLSRRENSTILESQRLGTVHIMEGTFFFVYIYTYIYKYMYKNMCVYVCVFVFFVVWCRWWWSGVGCGVVWC